MWLFMLLLLIFGFVLVFYCNSEGEMNCIWEHFRWLQLINSLSRSFLKTLNSWTKGQMSNCRSLRLFLCKLMVIKTCVPWAHSLIGFYCGFYVLNSEDLVATTVCCHILGNQKKVHVHVLVEASTWHHDHLVHFMWSLNTMLDLGCRISDGCWYKVLCPFSVLHFPRISLLFGSESLNGKFMSCVEHRVVFGCLLQVHGLRALWAEL